MKHIIMRPTQTRPSAKGSGGECVWYVGCCCWWAYLDAGQQSVDLGGLEVAEDGALDGQATGSQDAAVLCKERGGVQSSEEQASVAERCICPPDGG